MGKEEDPFERYEWTPPLLGWRYYMNWILTKPRDRPGNIWVGSSSREIENITISARIEPQVQVYWDITIKIPGTSVVLKRASSSFCRAAESIEAETERLIYALKALRS